MRGDVSPLNMFLELVEHQASKGKSMITRSSTIERETKETKIRVFLNLDGGGHSKIDTSYPFLDHMLSLFCYHSFFDMEILAKGDIEVDYHHLAEDIGICLGEAVKKSGSII